MSVSKRLAKRHPRWRRASTGRLHVEPLENRALLSLGLLGQWNGGSDYSDGWIVDDLAFIGHYGTNQGINVIDISDPTNPVQTAQFTSPGTTNDFRDIEVQWQQVGNERRLIGYVSGDGPQSSNGVLVVDFTDPYNPQQLYRIRANPDGGADLVHTLSVDGRYLYEADSRGPFIRVFDVSDPSQPRKVRDIRSTVNDAVHEVTAQNGRLYTAGIFGTSSAEIFDISRISEKGAPVTYLGMINGKALGERAHTTWPTDDGRFMAVARETNGADLSFWNIENPADPQLVWRMDLREPNGCCAHQVMIRRNLLFTSWYSAGVFVHDISDPYNPVELGHYDTFPGAPGGYSGAWGVFASRTSKIIGGFDRASGVFLLQLVDDPDDAPFGGGPFQGSDSRAVRGAWSEGWKVGDFTPDQIARLDGDILTITLGAGDDTVTVARGAGGQTVDVVVNGALRFSYAAAEVRRLNIRALEGDDRIVLDPRLRLEMLLDGGPGTDIVEGWSEAWVNPPITHRNGVHNMRPNPYGTLAIEDVRTVPAGGGPLDYSAHALVEHGGAPVGPAGADLALRLGHGGFGGSVVLGSSHRSASSEHALTRGGAGAEHLYAGGLVVKIVGHKPGCT